VGQIDRRQSLVRCVCDRAIHALRVHSVIHRSERLSWNPIDQWAEARTPDENFKYRRLI